MIKRIVKGGWVKSKHDGERHYINAMDLCRLYKFNPEESVLIEDKDEHFVKTLEFLYAPIFGPLFEGNYEEMGAGLWIDNDSQWKLLVKAVARHEASNAEITDAVRYLWQSYNWDRLSNTCYGQFIREVDSAFPDLSLRAVYREKVIQASIE